MNSIVVDMRSDTVTKPTPEMREAMAKAEVGDDVYREDQTIIRLEKYVADYLGKEAALFVSSGTMGNLTSIMSHCWERGCEAIVGDRTHIYLYEQGGAARLGGVMLKTLKNLDDGTFDLGDLESQIECSPDIHKCKTKLICLENTNNRCGGAVLPTSYVTEVCRIAKKYGVLVHMDGARLVNASVHLGEPVSALVKDCDSVSLCLSKGIGAPVGSVVAGSKEFISRVLQCRKLLGGAMRQVGLLGAAGMVALKSAEERLKLDHLNAQRFANAINELKSPLISVNLSQVQSNIVLLNFKTNQLLAKQYVARLAETSVEERDVLGQDIVVKCMMWTPVSVRCVFHSDISCKDLELAIAKVKHVVNAVTQNPQVNGFEENNYDERRSYP